MDSCKESALVSVIVPVYNVEAYIEKCMDSIVKQSYRNLEIIVVNDGSPDRSEEIIQKFAEKDPRIRYVKKENGGLSSARNCGLDLCSGKYVSFVDSDDWIHRDFIREMVQAVETDHSQIAVCNMTYIYSDGSVKKRTPVIDEKDAVSNITALNDLFAGKKFKFHAQNKLYLTELFQKDRIRYPEGKIYEDVFTTYQLIYAACRISYMNQNLYYYLQNRPGSILHTRFNKNRFAIFEALDQISEFIEKNHINIQKEFAHLVVINVISLVNYIYPIFSTLDDKEKREYVSLIQESSKRYKIGNYRANKALSAVEKIRYYMILNHMNFYVKVMRTLKR